MSKKDFNPYRDLLDIPSLKDENPTDYQLLGIDDFEGDSGKVAAAYEKRTQRIAELYQLVTEISGKIDAARDRITDAAAKEEYDLNLQRTGRAGVAHLGKSGFIAVLSSFIFSIIVVIVSTFYIYPMVVAVPVENFGDSVTTLPEYRGEQTKKEIDILKTQQEDITTMDVNFNMPIDVDADSSVDFLDVPTADIPGEETVIDDLPAEDLPLTVDEPTAEEPAQPELPAVEEPAPEEPAQPELPAVEEPATEEPALPELPAVEEPATEEPALPETPAVEEPAAEEPLEEDKTTVEKPSEDKPEVVVDVLEDVPLPDSVPSDNPSDEAAPTVPENTNKDNSENSEIPLPEKLDDAEPPVAPEPPVIPELSATPDTPVAPEPPAIPEIPTAEPSARPSGFALEDVDMLDQFVQMGQKARTDADFAQLLFSAQQAENKLMNEKDFQKAQQIADVVYSSCARSADKAYRAEAYRLKDLVSKRAAWWESVRLAQEKMDANGTVSPTDALLVARWKIEIENDWEIGLKYLALSENEQIRAAAENEIAVNQDDVRSILTVANSWWNLAQDPVPMQKQFRAHASQWYAKALPSIADKQVRTLIEKRIEIAERSVFQSIENQAISF